MKKNSTPIALLFIFLTLISSCTTTSHTYPLTRGGKTPIVNLECSTTIKEEVDLFYVKDSLNFSYEKIGYVNAFAETNVPSASILKRLQYNSYLLCGNGIIDISTVKIVKDGLIVNQYSGIAVRIEKDSTYFANYSYKRDYDYYNFATNDIYRETEKINGGATILGILGTILCFILLINGGGDDDDAEEEEDEYGI